MEQLVWSIATRTPLPASWMYILHRPAAGGHWVAAKGASPDAEVAAAGTAISKLGGKLLAVEEVDSGG